MSALLIKEAVNQTVDNMGFYNALNACFSLHELNHSHWAQANDDGYPVAKEDAGIPNWKEAPPNRPRRQGQGARRPVTRPSGRVAAARAVDVGTLPADLPKVMHGSSAKGSRSCAGRRRRRRPA
jgi:hypothetical protein